MMIALSIALVLSLGALAYVVWPLLRQGPAPVMLEDDRLTELLGRKDAVMMAIKELEFDYHVGKLSEEDYQLYDARLRRQAVGLLQQIEQVAPQSAGVDDALEAEIARRRRVAEPPAPLPAALPAAVPAAVPAGALGSAPAALQPVASAVGGASVLPAGNGAGVRFCTNCGNRIEPNHKFCANCGTPAGG
jgi:hypothetical protein